MSINKIFKIYGIKSKMLSRFVTKNNKLFNNEYFKDVYENNFIHDYEYTKKIYNNEFNEVIDKRYDVDTTNIKSGSVAQVYKAYDKLEKKYVAIKVLHLDPKYQYYFPNKIFNLYKYLITFNNFKKFKLIIDPTSFFNDIKNEFNLKNEFNNQKYFLIFIKIIIL